MTGWQVAVAGVAGAPGVVLGLLLLLRGPRVVGALLVALGLLPLALLSPDSSVAGRSPPHGLGLLLAVASVAGWVWLYVPPALLAAYFPDGRLGRGWWVLPAGWGVFLVAFHVAVALDADNYGDRAGQIPGSPPVEVPRSVASVLGIGSLVLLLALLVGSVARVVVRFRRGGDVVRRQLKWFALSILLLPIVLIVTWAAYLLTDVAGVVVQVGLLLVFVSMPVSIAIAVLRHDLYDVDTLVSRTVAYIVLTGGLVAVFAAVTVGIGVVAGRGSDLPTAVATLVCAAAFGLLRRRVQVVVDARFDRGRRDALIRLDRFLDEVRDGRTGPEQVESALREALHDPELRVVYWLPFDPTTPWRTGDGEPSARPEDPALDVAVAGRLLGSVGYDLAVRRPRLLREALRAAHLPLELAHSRIALRHALAETRASRARLVEAGDAERRRLERDLHDGAQQRLVAIGMFLRLAQQRADPADPLQQVLGTAVRDLQEALGELRQLAGGVRPRGLDEGLSAAIRGLVRTSPVPVEVHLTSDPVPDVVATTAYYVAAEALANALKHAEARSVVIDVTHRNGDVRVVVSDDGRGGATVRAGSGLAGLRDRVAATGGELGVESSPGIGTRVEARLPCGS
ncbi:signal transduction histidine kinase [Kribbella orskensis]|uniref:histidine kinase n=1 Tax=Kribbella orskensis TaxID=2512216 RepID=A0ABY2BMC5_9ACTN|nr:MULTISPECIES: sensor histidine kinase [Kribbella]TCN41701.1 signal transduction histidine kinase [Kribbella sp. VKM Ac-2500]TCO25579.1 signal transduction histidine kinase [Kribbella orskensis]